MIAHSMPFLTIISSDQAAREHYHVPKYQREYTWGKRDWERLLQDIDENDPGYFMGSLICVKDGDPPSPGDEVIYEVVDGQQRLTTLSLLMMVIYRKLSDLRETCNFDDEDERREFENTLSSLRNKLLKKKKEGEYRKGESGGWIEQNKMCFLRVQPSSQNHNLEDYRFILGRIGLIKECEKPRHHHVRIIGRAFRFFEENIPNDAESLLQLVSKINQLNFVHISVGSQADAFTLFETLNNRGVPLSAIDIIKNKILAEMEKQHRVNIDDSYDEWQGIVSAIPEASDQERFLRHFYNAFRWDDAVKVQGIPRAIKSKIIAIYEKLIKQDARLIFSRLCNSAALYGDLISPENNGFNPTVRDQLIDLDRINATPAFQLLLYLFSLNSEAFNEPDFLNRALDLIRKFYVRRNVTDIPGTRDLDQSHMDLIAECQDELVEGRTLRFAFFSERLLKIGRPADNKTFETALNSGIYASNILMTRYLLVKLDETYHTREYRPDLWARNDKDKFVWTVEHVLPQAERIPSEWVQMIAEGDRALASELHEQHVHRIGNLTLSGYNSKLSAASFDKKQALAENRKFLGHNINIGYKNGLALNDLKFDLRGQALSLGSAKTWRADMIDARTREMVAMLMHMYAIDGIK